jgi:hypothetical protein
MQSNRRALASNSNGTWRAKALTDGRGGKLLALQVDPPQPLTEADGTAAPPWLHFRAALPLVAFSRQRALELW